MLDKLCDLATIKKFTVDLSATNSVFPPTMGSAFNRRGIKLINTKIFKTESLVKRILFKHSPNKNKLRIETFSELIFANCLNLETQLGYVMTVAVLCKSISWYSHINYKFSQVAALFNGARHIHQQTFFTLCIYCDTILNVLWERIFVFHADQFWEIINFHRQVNYQCRPQINNRRQSSTQTTLNRRYQIMDGLNWQECGRHSKETRNIRRNDRNTTKKEYY